MILVTSAGGKTGRAVVRALTTRGETVRALTRSSRRATELRDLGVSEIVEADLLSAAGLARAMDGARAVYLIVPNMHPEESRVGEIAISAARAAGVELLVYHSVLHPQTRQMRHHWQKLAVEERLFESGIPFTVLQPAAYMQNVLAYWDSIVADGEYRVPYGEGAALSLVDLDDVAEVAAKVLTSERHTGAIYEIAGPETLSPADIAHQLSDSLARPVSSATIPIAEWIERARADGLDEHSVETLVKMFRYYDHYGLRGNPQVLRWLLGREPTSFSEFVQRAAAEHALKA